MPSQHVTSLTVAQRCGNAGVEAPEQCDGGNLNGATCATRGFAVGTLRCASGCTFDTSGCFATRFVDNGDGTVTDHETGLQWEKKTTTAGSGVNLDNPHDVDNKYTWNTTIGGRTPNGTAFTDFLAKLNGADDGTCFVNNCDWRLPKTTEFASVLRSPFFCGTHPCIDPVFGPTLNDFYWTAATLASDPSRAWIVSFFDGWLDGHQVKISNFAVRAVRGGS